MPAGVPTMSLMLVVAVVTVSPSMMMCSNTSAASLVRCGAQFRTPTG